MATNIEERIAQNETLFRDVNERIGAAGERHGHAGFVCECGEKDCSVIVNMTIGDYETVRSNPLWFFVVPGHEAPIAEKIIDDRGRYKVVEKKGEAARSIVSSTDPRAD